MKFKRTCNNQHATYRDDQARQAIPRQKLDDIAKEMSSLALHGNTTSRTPSKHPKYPPTPIAPPQTRKDPAKSNEGDVPLAAESQGGREARVDDEWNEEDYEEVHAEDSEEEEGWDEEEGEVVKKKKKKKVEMYEEEEEDAEGWDGSLPSLEKVVKECTDVH
ncbi:hypothetical protein HK097_005684, partial [Rhizophlyctis rosea]